MILLGSTIFLVNEILSAFLTSMTVSANTDFAALFGTGPVPAMPLYTVAGMSVATAAIGICLPMRKHPQHGLSLEEREEISRGLVAQLPLRTVASLLGRSTSTVSREIACNGGPMEYRAALAEQHV